MRRKTGTRSVHIGTRGRLGRGLLGLALLLVMVQFTAPAQAVPLYGETYLMSTSDEDGFGGDNMEFAAISKDGLRTFWSTSEPLLSADSDNDNFDIYERIETHTARLVTPGGDFHAEFLASSEDGSKVFFATEESIVGDGDGEVDIYRRNLDHVPPTTTIMTPNTSEPMVFKGSNLAGDRVFFTSTEQLTGNDSDDEQDVFMSENGVLTRISIGPRGGNEACPATYAGATPDGQHVFFHSKEWLTAVDTGEDDEFTCQEGYSDEGTHDAFRWSNGSVTNVTPTPNLISGVSTYYKDDRFLASSPDGSRVIFSHADSYCVNDVFAYSGGATTKLSPSQWDGTPSACSTGKGYYEATFVGASVDATQVFWITREPGIAGDGDERMDVFRSGVGGSPEPMTPNTPNADASFAWTSPDGNRLLFNATDPVVDDGDARNDVFENAGGAITKITKGPLGGDGNFNAGFSGATEDGEFIFFNTDEPLTSDDQDLNRDVYVRHDGNTELITTGPTAGTGNHTATFDAVSEDGERVFFTTSEKLVTADNDTREDVYMRWLGGPPSVQVSEFSLAPHGFVELLKSGEGQDEFPTEEGPYKLVAYDAAGEKVGEHEIAPPLLRGQALSLFSDTHPGADEPLEMVLPASGHICFTRGVGEARVSCVAWGCLATELDPTVIHVAAPGSGLSQQRQPDQPNVFELAAPTPKELNIAGTTAPACPSNPGPGDNPGGGGPGGNEGPGDGGPGGDEGGRGDTAAPIVRAVRQGKPTAGGPIRIRVTTNTAGNVVVKGFEVAKQGKRKIQAALKPVRAKLRANKKISIKLVPKSRKRAKQIRRAVKKSRAKASAKIVVVFRDKSGNRAKKTLSFSLR